MRHAVGTAFLLLLISTPLAAATPTESKTHKTVQAVKDELHRYVHDAKDLATTPLRWNGAQWTRFGEGLGAVAVTYAADAKLYDAVQRNRTSFTDDFSKQITPWGASRALKLSALMIVGGAIAGDAQWRDAGRDSLESQIWAAGVVTPLLKRSFGRSRPIQDEGARSFHPFDKSYESFPSGHSTNAWAFATAVAGHFDGWVVPTIVYTMASGVSFARVNDKAHFPADVLAGALIGRAVGKGIVARHQTAHTAWVVTPMALPRGAGVMVHVMAR